MDAAHAAGIQPTQSKESGRLILRVPGKGYKALFDMGGELTSLGRAWEERTGNSLEAGGYDPTQMPARDGDVEYIKMRSGKKVKTRTWNGVSFKYSQIGRSFYSKKRVAYNIMIPVNVRIQRDNGSDYVRDQWLPVTDLNVEQFHLKPGMTPSQIKKAFATRVLREAGAHHINGSIVLLQYSREAWVYDSTRDWKVQEMTTMPASSEVAGAEPTVSVRTDEQRYLSLLDVAVGTFFVNPALPFPEHLCQASLEENQDKLCAVRGIAEACARDVGFVLSDLNGIARDIYGDWSIEEKGSTLRIVQQ